MEFMRVLEEEEEEQNHSSKAAEQFSAKWSRIILKLNKNLSQKGNIYTFTQF